MTSSGFLEELANVMTYGVMFNARYLQEISIETGRQGNK